MNSLSAHTVCFFSFLKNFLVSAKSCVFYWLPTQCQMFFLKNFLSNLLCSGMLFLARPEANALWFTSPQPLWPLVAHAVEDAYFTDYHPPMQAFFYFLKRNFFQPLANQTKYTSGTLLLSTEVFRYLHFLISKRWELLKGELFNALS